MPIDNQAHENIIQSFAQGTGVPDGSVHFSSVESNNKSILTLQSTRTDKDGLSNDTQLIISETEKPNNYKLTLHQQSPNRKTDCEKIIVANSPAQICILMKTLLTTAKVCKRSPHIIGRIGNKIGSYI